MLAQKRQGSKGVLTELRIEEKSRRRGLDGEDRRRRPTELGNGPAGWSSGRLGLRVRLLVVLRRCYRVRGGSGVAGGENSGDGPLTCGGAPGKSRPLQVLGSCGETSGSLWASRRGYGDGLQGLGRSAVVGPRRSRNAAQRSKAGRSRSWLGVAVMGRCGRRRCSGAFKESWPRSQYACTRKGIAGDHADELGRGEERKEGDGPTG